MHQWKSVPGIEAEKGEMISSSEASVLGLSSAVATTPPAGQEKLVFSWLRDDRQWTTSVNGFE